MNYYTAERNIQILISLLKGHNIKKVIASPGSTNISFVESIRNDDFFEVYSCVDERSAAYLACGMAADTKEPVVLTCTGATASRNYFSGLTEAYYRKLPIIAITATQHLGRTGQNIAQVIDRNIQPKDIVKKSIQLTSVYSEEDAWACNLNVNQALIEARRNGGGPVHINMVTTYSNDFTIKNLPNERIINRISYFDKFPKINKSKVAIFVGNHNVWDSNLVEAVDNFCEKYNGVVLCDHTSNYNGKYKVLANLICNQEKYNSSLKDIDLLIDIGNVSGAYLDIKPKEVWRVNPDGEIRDQFKRLRYIFEMEELQFFKNYNEDREKKIDTEYYKEWKTERDRINNKIEDDKIPFSNIWIAKNTIDLIPNNSKVHLAILNTLRSWNYFDNSNVINFYCNTGGFGIDGCMSSMIGASYANPNELVYGIIGDLAFFYDMNSLGLRDISNNLRIILINNGSGTEFHNYNHRAMDACEEVGEFTAADRHNGNKSKKLVKDYAENLGFKYYSASNKKEFKEKIENFLSADSEQSIIFEIFTSPQEESDALRIINSLEVDGKFVAKNEVKSKLKKIIGKDKVEKIKKMIKNK